MALQARFSGRAAALAALYASALCLNDAGAFTPTALLQSSSSSAAGGSGRAASSVASSCAPFLSSCPTHGASALSGGGGGGGTGTALSMNFVDEFVSSTDLKTRKADNDRYLSTLNGRIERINGLESTIEELGDDELAAKSVEFRKRLADGEDINGPIVEEAFAVVREAAWCVSFFMNRSAAGN